MQQHIIYHVNNIFRTTNIISLPLHKVNMIVRDESCIVQNKRVYELVSHASLYDCDRRGSGDSVVMQSIV